MVTLSEGGLFAYTYAYMLTSFVKLLHLFPIITFKDKHKDIKINAFSISFFKNFQGHLKMLTAQRNYCEMCL